MEETERKDAEMKFELNCENICRRAAHKLPEGYGRGIFYNSCVIVCRFVSAVAFHAAVKTFI